MNTPGTPNSLKALTQQRILSAAAGLFAQFGYRGTRTRAIASAARLNEATIFRYFPRKRDLYLAVLGAELQKITLRGDLLGQIADAPDSRTALAHAFELVMLTVAEKPELVRLVQYGSLELNSEFDPILRYHIGQLVEVISSYLDRWIVRGELRCSSSKTLVLAVIAIALGHDPLHRIFSAESDSRNGLFEMYSQLYAR